MADLQTKTVMYGTTDAGISKVSVNNSTTYTTDTMIKIGLGDLTITDIFEQVDTMENEQLSNGFTILKGLDVSFKMQSLNTSALALINGLTVINSGVTPNRTVSMKEGLKAESAMFNLKIQTIFATGEISDQVMEIYCVKGRLSLLPKNSAIWDMEFKGKAYAREKTEAVTGDRLLRDFIGHETFTALS